MAFHMSLNVSDLPRSVAFYRAFFGREPAKAFDDYAKFEVEDPALVLSLEPTRSATNGGALNHFGIRVADGAGIRAYYERLAAAGLETQWIAGVECCYSRQSKIVAHDPDGNLVEVYVVEEDLEARSQPAPVVERAGASGPETFTHLLGTPTAPLAALSSASLDHLALRGTFNAPDAFERRVALLGDALRALKPGGELSLHMLVGDRRPDKPLPPLPAPAQHVSYVPALADVLAAVEGVAFVDTDIRRLSHAPVMVFDGVEMRELLLHARRAPESGAEATMAVVYKGPLREIVDDSGVVFRRGEPRVVAGEIGERLTSSAMKDAFVVLRGDGGAACKRD